jgi:hypothetical protein
MSQVRKIERIRVGIEMIGETTFPIDALPTDLLLLILQQLLSYDIRALLMTRKGTVNALNRIDQHYHIWKSIFLRQKYMSPSDVNSTPENDWKRLLVKDDRVRANWCKGKFEVNYLTPIGGRQIDFQPVEPSNDNWMVFKSKHESVTYLMLWNCEQQRMWAAHGVLDHVLSPVFVNEGTSYVPPLVAVGINARDRIVLFRDQEHISLKIHLPSVGSNGLEHIHCCVNNKLYNTFGYADINTGDFIEFSESLELATLQKNVFNERILYGKTKTRSCVLLDTRANMNVIQTLESFDYITFVDEYTVMNRKVLNARRGQEVLSLHDIRKINEAGPISPELSVAYTSDGGLNVDLHHYRIVCQEYQRVKVYKSNTLEQEGQWTYEGQLSGVNGRYMVATSPPSRFASFGRTTVLDFSI